MEGSPAVLLAVSGYKSARLASGVTLSGESKIGFGGLFVTALLTLLILLLIDLLKDRYVSVLCCR